MLRIGEKLSFFSYFVDRLANLSCKIKRYISEEWNTKWDTPMIKKFIGDNLISKFKKIINDIENNLPNEKKLVEIEKEICKGVSNSTIGNTIKKRAREMAILILFEVQHEEGKVPQEYINSWIKDNTPDNIKLLKLIDGIQNPIRDSEEIAPIEEEICKELSDSEIGNVIKRRARDMAVFILNEIQYDKSVKEKYDRLSKNRERTENNFYTFNEEHYIEPFLKDGMLYSDKLKLLIEKAKLAKNHYTFGGYFIDEENMVNFLIALLIVMKDYHYIDKRSRGIEESIRELFNCKFSSLYQDIYNLLSEAVCTLDGPVDESTFSVSYFYYSPPDLVTGLENFNNLIDIINKRLPEIIDFERVEKEVDQFKDAIDKNYPDSDIWSAMKKYLGEVAETVYDSRKQKSNSRIVQIQDNDVR